MAAFTSPAATSVLAATSSAPATSLVTSAHHLILASSTAPSSTSAGPSAPAAKPHNQSPITVYTAPPKPFRPDRLATIDLIIVVIYLCLLLSTSISTMMRTKRSNKRKAKLAGAKGQPTNNFLAAGRKMNWFTVGLSIFASNLGSEHFIGLSGSAAATGISVAAFELNALFLLQLATWVFLPVLIVSRISTLPEYMSKRFGGKRIRTYLAVLSILLYIFTKISVNLFSGGIFIQQAIGWNLYSSAMFILGLTCVMTLTGGVKGAMVIDNLQAVVMTVGASIVSAKALAAIGGLDGLRQRYSAAVPTKVPANLTHCAQTNPRAFQLLRPWDDKNMPWLGFLIGQTPASIWYWAADQMMVQRYLSARSLAHVQGSSVFAGYLKILPLIFMVIPGMISRCLYTDEVGCIDPIECQRYCQSSVSCSNTAYPRLVLELMPSGARGMMVAAMVAALMGDLCNVFNSASALFSCDIYPLFRKHSTQKEQETAGRVFVICLVLASIMWIPVIQEMQGGQLFIYIQAVSAMFAPPICAVYICAVLSTRTNETGAFWSMMIGFALGLGRLAMNFMYKEPGCGQELDERPWILKHVHYMYFAAVLFFLTVALTLLISRLTKPPAPFRLIRTTYWTRFDTGFRKDDKNVFEMKYSGATTSSSMGAPSQPAPSSSPANRAAGVKNGIDTIGGDSLSLGKSSQQRLFTIDEQQEKRAADLSSVIVDINAAAAASSSTSDQPTTAPISTATTTKRVGGMAQLQHQASLGAAQAVAVANKLASEVNLKGAKEMVRAAASHLTGGQVKFQNLRERDEDDEDDDDDDDDDYEKRELHNKNQESTTLEEEEEEEENGDHDGDYGKRKRLKRNRRQQSVLSALSSYKMKQKGGYKKAANFDEFEDDEEEDEDDDDDDDEHRNLNRSASFRTSKSQGKRNRKTTQDNLNDSSTDGDRQTPTPQGALGDRVSAAKRQKQPTQSQQAKRKRSMKTKTKGSKMMKGRYEEEVDEECGRTYKCLDNSVSLLIKTRFEEAVLRVATVAIIFVAIGLYIILSLPPTPPPKDVVDILIKN